MKKLLNLKGAQTLSKTQKQTINGGGDPPCGDTGANYLPQVDSEAHCNMYAGSDWHNGKCYICH